MKVNILTEKQIRKIVREQVYKEIGHLERENDYFRQRLERLEENKKIQNTKTKVLGNRK